MRPSIFLLLCLSTVCGTAQTLWQPWYIGERAGSQHIDLAGKWELSYTDSIVGSLPALAQVKNAFETTIPNSVQWSLFEAGKLPHPYYHKNSDQYRWTDEKVWYYKKRVDIPAGASGNYIFLCFDGLDYFSRVWVNDSLIGEHQGMFGGPNIEIGRYLHYGSSNEIVVELRAGDWGNKAEDYEKLPRTKSGEFDYSNRKGYNPRASGRIIKPWVISGGSGCEMFFSLGMWQGARIEIVPHEHLERPFLVTRSIAQGKAELHLSTEIFIHSHSLLQQLHPWKNAILRQPNDKGEAFVPATGKLTMAVELWRGSKRVYSKDIPLHIFEGRNWLEQDISIADPVLWDPIDTGRPALYQVKLALKKEDAVIDRQQFDYGIRMIERVPGAGPRTGDRFDNWQFVVNGRKIFVKGMDFTLQDVLLKTDEDRYRWTLTAAKKMGVQMIRIWGGGLIETNIFYTLCDELGLMVWQDFPIGNEDTPDYPQDIWEAQVVQNICRLRNHASLVVWCGGNEFNPYSSGNAATMGILERNIHIFDDSRIYVRTSPDDGSIHAYPDMDPCWYDRSYGHEPWISETGMHSMPEPALFYELVDNKEFTGLGKMWEQTFAASHPEFIHHFTEYGPSRVPRMLSRASHIADMSDPGIESVSEATQVGAGEFYQILSEKVQGNYPVTTGLMTWVFKRHWPVIAIQMMDWFGHTGAPYYFLKRTYEPTHIAINLPRLLWAAGEKMELPVKITNALPVGGDGYKISTTVYDDAFGPLYKKEQPVRLGRGTAVTAASGGAFTIPAIYRDRFLFVLAELKDAQGQLISRSWYYPRVLSRMEDTAFYRQYTAAPMAWPALDKGPWLKPTVAKTKTSLSVSVLGEKRMSAQESELRFRVKNTGRVPAFMVEFDITGVKRAFYASDNYLWLQPGEEKEFTMQVLWREASRKASLQVHAWNAAIVLKDLEK